MTDTTIKPAEIKTVGEHMKSRQTFETIEAATAYLVECQESFSDFADLPHIAVGLTDEGDFDPAVYTESMLVTVAKMTEKLEGTTRARAIVIYATPRPASVIENPEAHEWLAGLIEKEANLVALRPLRKATTPEEMADAVDSMPRTLLEYITTRTETTSGILETYNKLWQTIKAALAKGFKSWSLANLSKKEMRKAMESASYAAAVYDRLENRQNKAGEKDSLFVKAAQLGALLAKEDGLDPAIFDRMLETRDDREIEIAGDEDAEDFDLEAMAASLAKKDAPADA
jgi:hypothetical protein